MQVVHSTPVSRAAAEEALFGELRRKVRQAELLSAALEKILYRLQFTGRLTVVLRNGRVQQCGYEEGCSRRRTDFALPT